MDQFQTRVVVDHDGKVKWMGPIVLRTSCQVDIKMFPFDTQVRSFVLCKLYGNWVVEIPEFETKAPTRRFHMISSCKIWFTYLSPATG